MSSEFCDQIEYPNKLVAFLDILGFRNMVMGDELSAKALIGKLDRHLNHVVQILKDEHGKDFSARLFSDCMCISCEDTKENLFYVLFELAFIQFYLSRERIFLRGALSRGRHFESERIIFSKGLVNAYHLERTAAYPRVLIDAELIKEIMADEELYSAVPYQSFERSRDFVVQWPDAAYAVDCLRIVQRDGLDAIEELGCHKGAIETTAQKHSGDTSIVSKYRWLSEYHNFTATEILIHQNGEEMETLQEAAVDTDKVFPGFRKC